MDINTLINHQNLEEIQEFIDWHEVVDYPLPEAFAEKYLNFLPQREVMRNNKFSEEFLERNKDRITWYYVCRFQTLSEEFIERFAEDRITDWDCILNNQNLSKEFKEKHRSKRRRL